MPSRNGIALLWTALVMAALLSTSGTDCAKITRNKRAPARAQGQSIFPNPFNYFAPKTPGAAQTPARSGGLTSPVNLFGFLPPLPNLEGLGILKDVAEQFSPQNLLKTLTDLPSMIMNSLNAGQCLVKGFAMLVKKGIFFATHLQKIKSPFNLLPIPQLKKMLDFKIPKADAGDTVESVISVLEYVLADSPHRAHPFYLKRDAAGLDPYAVAGDILAITITIAGVAASKGEGSPALLLWVLLQKLVGLRIRKQIGYVYGDAIMTAGPSVANIMAVHMALAVKYPTSMIKGLLALDLEVPGAMIMISEGNNDFFRLFGLFPGLPEGLLIRVKMDRNGRMDVKDLEKKIVAAKQEKKNPFMIIASAGTKNLGAIDPISEIADIAEKYDLWLHIDGTHGAPVFFSPTHKAKLEGAERSNSFTWGASSMLGVPAPSSYLVTRMENPLESIWKAESAFEFVAQVGATAATNLFQAPKFTDAAKVFLMWLVKGQRGLGQHVDYSYSLARSFVRKIKGKRNFKLITKQMDTPVVSFNWVPDDMLSTKGRRMSPAARKAFNAKISAFTERLQVRILVYGLIYLSTARLRPSEPKYFIASFANSIMIDADLDYLIAKIDCEGRALMHNKMDMCFNSTLARLIAPLKSKPSDFFPYINAAMPDLHLKFFTGFFEMFMKKALKMATSLLTGSREGFDAAYTIPGELTDMVLGEEGLSQNDFWQYVEHVFTFGLKGMNMTLGAMKFIKGFGCAQVLGGFVTALMGPVMQNYQSSPVFTMVSTELKRTVRERVYTKGSGDGAILSPDGTMSAMYVLKIAKKAFVDRYAKKYNIKPEDMKPKLVFYISEDAFLSWKKAAAAAGLGLENAVYVPTDPRTGKMSVAKLKEKIEETKANGGAPFLVVGTVGSQVLGAIDPLNEIAAVCKEQKLWFHVDAQTAGSMIFSDKHLKRLVGMSKSDSFSFNPSRFYEDNMDLTILVTKKKKAVDAVFNKPFVQEKKFPDTERSEVVIDEEGGDIVTGGRGADEFTFWLVLKAQGMGGAGRDVDSQMFAVQRAVDNMKKRPKFELILDAFETTTICFNYLHRPYDNRKSNATKAAISKAQADLVAILKQNKVWDISLVKSLMYLKGQFAFLKLDVTKYDKADLDVIIDKVDAAGRQLAAGKKANASTGGGFGQIFGKAGAGLKFNWFG